MVERPRIGIIGDGNVGSALTQGLSRAGYLVDTVGREPARVREVARRAEVIMLAVPYAERASALSEMGDAVDGKALVDVTNAVGPNGQFVGALDRSGAEELQQKARGAKVVKAFNTIFAQNLPEGSLHGERLTAFYAGDDARAKRLVHQMADALGFDPVDVGPLQNARWLETLGVLTMKLGIEQDMGPAIGFRLLHPQAAPAREPTWRTTQRS